MKNLKTAALFLLALILSANAQAGDNKTEAKSKSEIKTATKAKDGDMLYWFNPSVSAYQFSNTKADEQTRTGCDGSTSSICEKGYTQDQLVDPNDPSQGVLSSEQSSPTELIRIHIN